jgi:hypothetical protein
MALVTIPPIGASQRSVALRYRFMRVTETLERARKGREPRQEVADQVS